MEDGHTISDTLADLSGEPVDVYRNLHLPGRHWSIRSRRSGLVVARAPRVIVEDVTFVVNRGGRARAQREGVRNVHAFVRGTLSTVEPAVLMVPVTYNPFNDAGFVGVETGDPVAFAKVAVLDCEGCKAHPH